MTIIEVEINGKQLTVKKIPLGKYPKIIASLQGLAAHKDKLADLSSDTIFQVLPDILMTASPEVFDVIAAITEQPKEEIELWGLDDFVRVIEAIFEVNDYRYIYTTLKKAMASVKVPDNALRQTLAPSNGTPEN